jgi:hypothetical protein
MEAHTIASALTLALIPIGVIGPFWLIRRAVKRERGESEW